MKKQYIIIGSILVVFALACVIGGSALGEQKKLDQANRPGQTQALEPANTPEQSDAPIGAVPSFAIPTPIPSPADALAAGGTTGGAAGEDSGATVVTDEEGNVTITPDWDAKREGAHIAAKEPTANMGGSGGGSMDLEDGVYQGDHPNATPTPTPVTTPTPMPTPTSTPTPAPSPSADPSDTPQEPTVPSQTPATPTPSPTPSQPSGGSTPPDRPGSYDGELSPDGKYGWFEGFGWVERGEGSYGIPENGPNKDLTGEKVGDM